ncbi:hypothetical protein Prudu_017392 [Prunus dulcis]|uniref:Uncharacterized protein n=1 Tax=Prunus dulcis TaxID=3755 RepID=A0A4Y1RNG9_PRUDU|nr:hypothetical protein Prudu_017392 [Prunus dulcis]
MKVFRFAFAIVSGETVNNWRWFLQKISDVLLDSFIEYAVMFFGMFGWKLWGYALHSWVCIARTSFMGQETPQEWRA